MSPTASTILVAAIVGLAAIVFAIHLIGEWRVHRAVRKASGPHIYPMTPPVEPEWMWPPRGRRLFDQDRRS